MCRVPHANMALRSCDMLPALAGCYRRASAGHADILGSNQRDRNITRVRRPVAVGIRASRSVDAELGTILLWSAVTCNGKAIRA